MNEKSKVFDKIKKCLTLSKSSNQHNVIDVLDDAVKQDRFDYWLSRRSLPQKSTAFKG
jgi:hypothetical protein